MNVTNLVLYLKSKITDDTLDQAMVSKAIKLLELGAVYQAGSITELPTASAANAGQLYYVVADGLYWSTGVLWLPIVNNNNNGSFWSWGENTAGQLGDNSTISRSSPVSVVGGFTDWCQLSAGVFHSVGIRSDGTAWSWGCNGSGRLGDNCTTNRSSPVSVVGGFTDWCQISSGCTHSIGVRTNGTAWGWGSDGRFIGNNNSITRSSPVSVVGGFTDWCQVSAGFAHSAGVRSNCTLWAWGCGSLGRLGQGTQDNTSSPVSVVGGFTDWCQVSAGAFHNIALRTNGTIWSWGQNSYRQLGDNTSITRSSPVPVIGEFTDWFQISAGVRHNVAVRTNGTAWAWGDNCYGKLGNNSTIMIGSPVSVVGGFTNWCQVSAGCCHSLGVRSNGISWAWGGNCCGRFGDNTTINRSSPVSVVGGFTNWTQISAGNSHSLAITRA